MGVGQRLAQLDHDQGRQLGDRQLSVRQELLERLSVDELGDDVRRRGILARIVEDLQDSVVVQLGDGAGLAFEPGL